MDATPQVAKNLVDVEHGLVSREIFVDEALYRREQETVFARSWLFVGHESQVPKPGDYVTSSMGDNPVILSRDKQGEVHVYLNSCRHRGMKVCRYDEGNASVFTCPYHGWSYTLDGRLAGVPHYQEAYNGELDKSQWGLIEVAQTERFKGSIWATWDPSTPSFEDYLGDFRVFLDDLLDDNDGEVGAAEVIPGVQRWLVPCNWKIVSENFAGDHYHGPSHVSVEAVGIGPGKSGETRHGDRADFRAHLTSFPELGHCWRGGPPSPLGEDIYPFPSFEDPIVEEYFRNAYEVRRRRPTQRPPSWLFGGGGNVFPNMSFHVGFPRTILVAQPRGPLVTEMCRWFLVDKKAPPEVKDHLRRYYLRYSGPAGMTEQDDMENWKYATDGSKPTIARRYPFNYQQALGHSHPCEELAGGVVTDGPYSEANALTLLGHWARLMDGVDGTLESSPLTSDSQGHGRT